MDASCVCGETQLSAVLKNHHVNVCHCSICRKQSSGVMMTIDIEAQSLHFNKQQYLTIYKSSEWGERGFCQRCGTNLFWRTQDGDYCNINVFALHQQPEDLNLDTEIYIDNKPHFYDFKCSKQQLTEAEVMALFSSQPTE